MEGRSLGGRSLTTLSSTATTTTTNMWPQSMGKRLLIPSNTTTSTAATTTTTTTTTNNDNSNSNSNCINNKKSNTMTQVSSPARGKERALECPRCNSSNTKFCYYNNYSLSQPRHFCKACKRYWTRGGTLRNVPVGGGCRKNKRAKKPAPITSAATPPPPAAPLLPPLSLPPLESSLNPLFFSSDMGFSFPLPPSSSSSSPPPPPPPSSCANFDLQPSHLNSLSLGYHHLVSPLNNSDLVTTDHNLLQFEENANSGMIKLEAGDILASSNFGMGMSMGMGMGMGISSSTSIPLDPSFLYWNAPLF